MELTLAILITLVVMVEMYQKNTVQDSDYMSDVTYEMLDLKTGERRRTNDRNDVRPGEFLNGVFGYY
jgi:hypothetical protein